MFLYKLGSPPLSRQYPQSSGSIATGRCHGSTPSDLGRATKQVRTCHPRSITDGLCSHGSLAFSHSAQRATRLWVEKPLAVWERHRQAEGCESFVWTPRGAHVTTKWMETDPCVGAHCCLVAKLRLTLLRLHGLQPTRLLCPWDSPGENTGVGCHAFLQGIFLAQGSNLHLLLCRHMLYHWATREALLEPVVTSYCDHRRIRDPHPQAQRRKVALSPPYTRSVICRSL